MLVPVYVANTDAYTLIDVPTIRPVVEWLIPSPSSHKTPYSKPESATDAPTTPVSPEASANTAADASTT